MAKKKTSFTKPLKVLIVEDTLVDLKIMERMLNQSSYDIYEYKTARNLKSALKILDKMNIDVVVLDLNLPDSSGVATLLTLNEKHPNVAVVINTGAYEDDLGLKTMSMGAQDFIIKGKYKAYTLSKSIQYASERKQFELALQDAQNQLVQAEKMNVVGRLASGVAHEVKNPLATILFGIAYLNETIDSDDEKIQFTLKSIKESAHRADNIIKDLLDFSSLTKLNQKPEDIQIIIEKSLSLTQHSLHKKAIKVTKDFGKNLPEVNIDKNRIEQVIVNIILNAVHAMPKRGTLKVKTSAKRITDKDSDNDFNFSSGTKVVVVEIEDDGLGISKDEMKRIFDPFFTTKRELGGIGLGLSVAKNLIEMHGGQILIKNMDKKGVRATILLKNDKN